MKAFNKKLPLKRRACEGHFSTLSHSPFGRLAMSTVVRLAVLCSVSFHIAVGVDLLDTFFRWASLGWSETPATFTRDIVRRNGFQAETHRVETDDGYILHATRIIANRAGSGYQQKLPILMMHGLLSSSDHWLTGGRDKDLPFLLAEIGHDVWLGDWRGNTFSRDHAIISPSNPSYWNFTYYYRALHDLPVFIDRVLVVSQAPQLIYIGYSYGTTAVMVLGTALPEYTAKIKQAILLAPVGYRIRNMNPQIQVIVDSLMSSYKTTTRRALFELLPRKGLFVPVWRMGCATFSSICMKIMFHLFGQRRENIDPECFRNLMNRTPSGTSSLDVIYLAQIFARGFRAYDYGKKTNFYVYGQKQAPLVRIENNNIPMALYYSPTDHLNSEQGVFELGSRLGNVTFIKKVPVANFSHIDYMIGKYVKTHLYDDIINFIVSLS